MLLNIILLLIGFVLLIKWADLLVEGGSSVATKLWVSALVIGLTIVAFWTSAPEFIVSMLSASSWESDLAISNILGSNISNILLILGTTAVIFPVVLPISTIKKEIPFLVWISLLLIALLWDGVIWWFDWAILLFFFVCFIAYSYITWKKGSQERASAVDDPKQPEVQDLEEKKSMSTMKASIFIILWLAWLIIGGQLIVDNAVEIAESFGLSKAFIGVTIVAIGTSLPELAASVIAAIKKQTDMAVGWVVGSNVFNTLWIGWATSVFFPINAYTWITVDLTINSIAAVLLLLTAYVYTKWRISRLEWVLFLGLYFSYIGYLVYGVMS